MGAFFVGEDGPELITLTADDIALMRAAMEARVEETDFSEFYEDD